MSVSGSGLVAALFVISVTHHAHGAIEKDRVRDLDLPGLSFTPNFKHYSGYLNATGTKKLHYWFLESQGNPSADPVVLWMNGGPGCSSMDGLLSEHGPFIVADDGQTLVKNAYSWNKVANMLYLEAPAGVGYSYSADKNYKTNDDQVSLDNYEALKYFFKYYPEYSKNEFFVTGESYGGVYVPTLSVRVAGDPAFNFKGFAVGNGLTDYSLNDNSLMYFAYYHGLLPQSLWSDILDACCQGQTADICNFTATASSQCQNSLSQASSLLSQLNIYNLYHECHTAGLDTLSGTYDVHIINPVHFLFSADSFLTKSNKINPFASSVKEVPPCINTTAITMYLNNPNVRAAIHIPSVLPKWEICSGTVGALYQRVYTDMKGQYDAILQTNKYRVLVYNGDVDMACNFLGDQWFVDGLKQKLVREWHPWFYLSEADHSSQIAGFTKEFNNMQFVTVKGAGHMVPQDKPEQSLKMFTNFIQNKPM